MENLTELHNQLTEKTLLGDLRLPQPWWLKNSPDDDVWYLIIHTDGNENSAGTINWNYVAQIKDKVNIGSYAYWIRAAKRAAYYYMESDKTACTKPSSLAIAARGLRSMCLWFYGERNCRNLSCITKYDIKMYEKYIKSLRVTKSAVISKLSLLKLLWTLRKEIGSGLVFNPYVKNSLITKKAKVLGVKGGHTTTIKPYDLFNMLNFALGELKGADEWIEKLNLYLNIKLKQKIVKPSVKFKRLTGISSPELFEKIRVIYGSAVMVILSLLAERKHELSSTKYSDVLALLATTDIVLDGTEHKTSGTISGESTKRPVIKEVKDALKIVIKLTEETRKNYDGELFFIRAPINHPANKNPQTELTTGPLYKLMDFFSISSGYNKNLRPHMPRRAFSMIWTWRYELGDLHLLSKILFHNNEVFTKSYIEDEDVWEYLPDAQQDLAFDIMEHALLGDTKLSGGFGKTLERYRRLIISKVTLVTPEKINLMLKNLFLKTEYRVIAHDDGYCFMSKSREKNSRCSTDGIRPNYSNRKDEFCVSCPNFGTVENRIPHWEKRHEQHHKVLKSSDNEMLKKSSKEAIRRIEKLLRMLKKSRD